MTIKIKYHLSIILLAEVKAQFRLLYGETCVIPITHHAIEYMMFTIRTESRLSGGVLMNKQKILQATFRIKR
jgi:hypothetical protein